MYIAFQLTCTVCWDGQADDSSIMDSAVSLLDSAQTLLKRSACYYDTFAAVSVAQLDCWSIGRAFTRGMMHNKTLSHQTMQVDPAQYNLTMRNCGLIHHSCFNSQYHNP